MWNAAQYTRFSYERSRPGLDLLAQIQLDQPHTLVDLGCGTGHLTRQLAERWPSARVLGVDSSPEMLAEARKLSLPNRLEFVEATIETWTPAEPLDLIFSNAALQWVDGHEALLARLTKLLRPGGALAVQMPSRFETPSQYAIEATAAEPRWAKSLAGVGLHRESVQPAAWYVHQLLELGCAVNAWETTYIHVLSGADPVLEWFKGTALRPLLARLKADEVDDFLSRLAERLRLAYPAKNGVTLLPFPRLFWVAVR
jgi:trans-aconitate 2-methyltransferase